MQGIVHDDNTKDESVYPRFSTFNASPQMIYVTQLIYINPGQESVFDQFENIAIPIIQKYNGKLLLRVRPDVNSYIEHHIEKPYEIHLVEFESEEDLQSFNQDAERRRFLHLKEQSIRASILIQGRKL